MAADTDAMTDPNTDINAVEEQTAGNGVRGGEGRRGGEGGQRLRADLDAGCDEQRPALLDRPQRVKRCGPLRRRQKEEKPAVRFLPLSRPKSASRRKC